MPLSLMIITALVLTICPPAPPRAAAEGPTAFGVSSLATQLVDEQSEFDAEAQAIQNVGGQWIRIVMLWHHLEPWPGQYNWTLLDRAVQAAVNKNLKILGLITGPAPIWAQTLGFNWAATGNPPRSASTYGNIARVIAQRYGARINTWEIWNEPNLPHFFSPVNVPKYVEMLKAAYTSIHAVQPNATVISGGLSSETSGLGPIPFIQQMYANGAKGYMDAVGMHPYTIPFPVADDPYGRGMQVAQAYGIMSNNGDAGKKIWITEYGQPTGTSTYAVSEVKQTDILIDFLQRAATVPYLGPPFLFTTRDISTDASNPHFNCGLYRFDFTPKEVVTRFRAILDQSGAS
jgi:hypothetical protein